MEEEDRLTLWSQNMSCSSVFFKNFIVVQAHILLTAIYLTLQVTPHSVNTSDCKKKKKSW